MMRTDPVARVGEIVLYVPMAVPWPNEERAALVAGRAADGNFLELWVFPVNADLVDQLYRVPEAPHGGPGVAGSWYRRSEAPQGSGFRVQGSGIRGLRAWARGVWRAVLGKGGGA